MFHQYTNPIPILILVTLIALLISAPVYANHVVPEVYSGNVTCTVDTGGQTGLGFEFGYKPQPEPPPSGDYTFPNSSLEVMISSDGTEFAWQSQIPLTAVIVKGGNASNVYIYDPAETLDQGLHSPLLDNGNIPEISHIEFCYDQVDALVVTKTAAATWEISYDWSIDKTITPDGSETPENAIALFAGDSQQFDYTVTATRTVTETAALSGTITVTNPTAYDDVVFEVTDSIAGVVVDCPANTLDAGESVVCTWSLPGVTVDEHDGELNEATATVTSAPQGAVIADGAGTAPIDWPDAAVEADDSEGATATIADVAVEGDPDNWSDAGTPPSGDAVDGEVVEYAATYTCSTDPDDYEGGSYFVDRTNIATLTHSQGEESDNEAAHVICYIPLISKTASGNHSEIHTWDIEKTVDPESQSGFVGDELPYTWTVTLTETVTGEAYTVSGIISVTNPEGAPADMLVSLADELDDGTIATIDCGDGTANVTVAPGATEECSYTASPADDSATLNTVTATFNQIELTATADVTWNIVIDNPTVTVDDDQHPNLPVDVTDGDTWTYEDSYTCSSDAADYGDDGVYTASDYNVATVSAGDTLLDSDDATAEFTCYAPIISKTASGRYKERSTWEVDKTVSPGSLSGFVGEVLNYTWTITVTETFTQSHISVNGTISVTNPAGAPGNMSVAVSDLLDNGTVGTVTCPGGVTTVSVAPGTTVECTYTAAPQTLPTSNTATGVFNNVNFTATVPITWTPMVYGGSVTLDDKQHPDLPQVITEGGVWVYEDSYTCPTSAHAYYRNRHTAHDYNVAKIYSGYHELDRDSARINFTCYSPGVNKTAETSYTRQFNWDIRKTAEKSWLTLSTNQTQNVEYRVRLIQLAHTDSNWVVSGQISVRNPHPDRPMTVSVADSLAGAVIDCGDGAGDTELTVPANSTATCSYSAPRNNGYDGKNIATVTLNGVNFTAKKYFEFRRPTELIDECVVVSDEHKGVLGTRCRGDGLSRTFYFRLPMGPYQTCDTNHTFTNTARFDTVDDENDTDQSDTSTHTLNISVRCGGCTPTYHDGYKSSYGGHRHRR